MPLPVPESQKGWETLARHNRVPFTQLFSDCVALPSGSKFIMEHYLPLRILVIDEKALFKKGRKKFRDRYIPIDVKAKVSATMKENKSVQEVKRFLAKSVNIEKRWNAENYRAVGPFGNGLEKLYQIVSCKSASNTESEDSEEDTTNLKIFGSEPSAPLVSNFNSKLNAAFQNMDINRSPPTPPHRTHLARSTAKPDYREFVDESSVFQTHGTDLSSMPGTEKRLAQLDFERATLVLSDEQTVNMCMENLLIALSNVMGYYGRVASDRRAFAVPKDGTSNIYQACVDGLILSADRQDIMAFIEVKRRLRSINDSVYRQIGAQMAAFIYSHDHEVNKHSHSERSMWMVSMEGYQAFIIVATYDQAYVDYLFSLPGSDKYNGFLTMVTSRAYDLRVWNGHMESFFRDVATLMGGPKED